MKITGKVFGRLFFIISIINIRDSSCVLQVLYETGQQVWRLYAIIENMRLDIRNESIEELEKQINGIHASLNEIEKFMNPKKILDELESWHLNAWTIKAIDMIEIYVERIDENYEKFHKNKNYINHSNVSVKVLMDEIINFLPFEINIIRSFVYGERLEINEEDLAAAIAGIVRARAAEMCGTPQVTSNIFIQLFRMIILAELKTSTILAYDNIYRYVMNEGDKQGRQRTNSLAREALERQFTIYLNIFSSSIAVIDIVYNSACDPPIDERIRDVSFYELEKSVRPILFSYNTDKCIPNSCYDLMFKDISRCGVMFHGEPPAPSPDYAIAECTFLGHVEACVLNSGPYSFHYVKSAVIGFLGKNSSCPKDNGKVIDTSTRPSAACECDFWSNQYKISVLPIESDVNSNRVVTGLKFVCKNKVLYIQMREAELKPNAYINESSQSWIDIFESEYSLATELINKQNRVFFLDDLILPSGYVLTGVQFKKVTRAYVTGFALKIFGRPFNYKTGIVSIESHLEQSWQGSNEESEKLGSPPLVRPIFTMLSYIVTSSDPKYVSLGRSALRENFGQSTLPFFEAVPLTIAVPSALGGVGISHKGDVGSTELISLRVYGIQYEKYFNDFKSSHIINNRVSFNSFF